MNVNEDIPRNNRGRGRFLKVMPIQNLVMGPPRRPVPKKKNTSSTYTTKTSSHIPWKTAGNGAISTTGTSSRSISTSEPESRVIIALSEGRGEAMCEVGIATINLAQPYLILCQISDSPSYINTLTKINILNPTEILVPLTFIDSFVSNRLVDKVKEQFPDICLTGVSRSSFNKNTGLHYVNKLCIPSMNSILLILQHKFYALAAIAALLTYTENKHYIIYGNESLKIEYQESEGATVIDVATADRLELVASARPTMRKKYSCLLDVLNHCYTKIGTLTLRASILQPPCSLDEIEARLNCVTELIDHPDMLAAIQTQLQKLTNIDQLLMLATVLPNQAQSCSERQLNYILLLNSVLEQVGPMRDIFENSTQPFFIELRHTLSNAAFTQVKQIIRTIIHTDAHPAKGKYGIIQRCFAIKPGVNGLLDIIRKTYSEKLDEMREYVNELGKKYNLALTLNNNNKKGYHILLTLNAHQKRTLKKSDIPTEFIQVERLSNSYSMKTLDLINISSRIEDINFEILKMSNLMIYKLLVEIRKHIGVFYKLCEDIAKLDMLQSLALASTAINYVRPAFSDYLEVTHARHPLLDFLCSVEPTTNNMFASKDYNMNIVTGPNGSGKSIYIRQVVLIQIMAQVGCYVPAESAVLRISDRILARIYLEDNMVCGASAFVLEIKEIQYFLTVATKNSLIIVDELCRSTSIEEGTALAMAVCEKLAKMPAFIFFTTHFKLITKLAHIYFNIKTWQMETVTEIVNNQTILHFNYHVIPGVTTLEHYGFFLARGSWPENLIQHAETIFQEISQSHEVILASSMDEKRVVTKLKYDLEAEFKAMKMRKKLSSDFIYKKLLEYSNDLKKLGYNADFSLLLDAYKEARFAQSESEDTGLNSQNYSIIFAEQVKSRSNDSYVTNLQSTAFDFQNFENVLEPEVIINTDSSRTFNFSRCSSQNLFLQPNKDNDDFSPEEHRFSLTLQQNLNKTSTPITTAVKFQTIWKHQASESCFENITFEPELQNLNWQHSPKIPSSHQEIVWLSDKQSTKKIATQQNNSPKAPKYTSMPVPNSNFQWIDADDRDLNFFLNNDDNFEISISYSPEVASMQDRNFSSKNLEIFEGRTTHGLNSKAWNYEDDKMDCLCTDDESREQNNSYITEDNYANSNNSSILTSQMKKDSIEVIENEDKTNINVSETNKSKMDNQVPNEEINISSHSWSGQQPCPKSQALNISCKDEELPVCVDIHDVSKSKTHTSATVEENNESSSLLWKPKSCQTDDESSALILFGTHTSNKSTTLTSKIAQCIMDKNEQISPVLVCETPENLTKVNEDVLTKEGTKSTSNSSSYIKWKPITVEDTPKQASKKLVGQSLVTLNDNHHYSDIELNTIVDEVRSCSQYFTDSNFDVKQKVVDGSETWPKTKKPKFVPPKRLTKKAIEQFYYEQDKKVLESADSSKYIDLILNRPSVKQLQQMKVVAAVQKTNDGIVVMPIKESKKRPKKQKFLAPLKETVQNFDVTLFSDKNVDKYKEFMNIKEDTTVVRQDLTSFQFIESQSATKESNKTDLKISNVKSPGYYTQHENDIDIIVNKYLSPFENLDDSISNIDFNLD